MIMTMMEEIGRTVGIVEETVMLSPTTGKISEKKKFVQHVLEMADGAGKE